MTPYEINIILHYYWSPRDHEDMLRNPPVWRPTIESFLSELLLEVAPIESGERRYQLTERGQCYVAGLQALPLPVQAWKMP